MSRLSVDLGQAPLPPARGTVRRWRVTRTYQTYHGVEVHTDDIEELWELHMLVEQSHDWNALVDIRIILNAERR